MVRNARQVSRELDALATDAASTANWTRWRALNQPRMATSKPAASSISRPPPWRCNCHGATLAKADNRQILGFQALRNQHPGRDVVLVSKDINMRIKARAMGLPAEDY